MSDARQSSRAYGNPLAVDLMSFDGLQLFLGIGEPLARLLELGRHENGEFVNLEDLVMVKDVGFITIERWCIFFYGL